jgi:hypothetical protein
MLIQAKHTAPDAVAALTGETLRDLSSALHERQTVTAISVPSLAVLCRFYQLHAKAEACR